MIARPARLAASVAALLNATTAFAEPTVQELDTRMRAMENTMLSILELLQAQQAAGGAPTNTPTAAATEVPTAAPAGYQMGGIYLDVFPISFSGGSHSSNYVDPAKLPDGPSGVPSGSVIIKSPDTFRWGDFVQEAELSGFKNADALIGVQWSGVIEIQETGPHTISLQLNKGSERAGSCRSVLRLSGKIIADAKGTYEESRAAQVDVAQSTQELEAGLYEFSLWTTCAGNRENSLKIITSDINMAAPGDRAPKPIPPDRFGVQP